MMDRNAPPAPPPKVEAHEAAEVSSAQRDLQKLLGTLGATARGRLVADDYAPAATEKLVFFIRHGEGRHNVAQRDWRAAKKAGEPYTVDNDPDFGYVDAELTEVGAKQAEALRPRFARLEEPLDLIVTSPMRRATQTALYALDHIWIAKIPVVAHEDCHETGGRHTCDKRLSRTALEKYFPPYDNLEGEPYKSRVDYAQLESEEDPLWHPEKREGKRAICKRAARFGKTLLAAAQAHHAALGHPALLAAFTYYVIPFEQMLARDVKKEASGTKGAGYSSYFKAASYLCPTKLSQVDGELEKVMSARSDRVKGGGNVRIRKAHVFDFLGEKNVDIVEGAIDKINPCVKGCTCCKAKFEKEAQEMV